MPAFGVHKRYQSLNETDGKEDRNKKKQVS